MLGRVIIYDISDNEDDRKEPANHFCTYYWSCLLNGFNVDCRNLHSQDIRIIDSVDLQRGHWFDCAYYLK